MYKALSLHLCTLQLYSSMKKMQGWGFNIFIYIHVLLIAFSIGISYLLLGSIKMFAIITYCWEAWHEIVALKAAMF